jgi:hypothetical protein
MQYLWIDIVTRSSGKFESLILDAQRPRYEFFKLAAQIKV